MGNHFRQPDTFVQFTPETRKRIIQAQAIGLTRRNFIGTAAMAAPVAIVPASVALAKAENATFSNDNVLLALRSRFIDFRDEMVQCITDKDEPGLVKASESARNLMGSIAIIPATTLGGVAVKESLAFKNIEVDLGHCKILYNFLKQEELEASILKDRRSLAG